jgi:hypothetical protein
MDRHALKVNGAIRWLLGLALLLVSAAIFLGTIPDEPARLGPFYAPAALIAAAAILCAAALRVARRGS